MQQAQACNAISASGGMRRRAHQKSVKVGQRCHDVSASCAGGSIRRAAVCSACIASADGGVTPWGTVSINKRAAARCGEVAVCRVALGPAIHKPAQMADSAAAVVKDDMVVSKNVSRNIWR